MVASKLMFWSWRLPKQQRGGLASRQFVRCGLLRLQLGDDQTHIITGKAIRRPIAPAEEVLALLPGAHRQYGLTIAYHINRLPVAATGRPDRPAVSARKNRSALEGGEFRQFYGSGLDIAIYR
jgi:hypothetical protein